MRLLIDAGNTRIKWAAQSAAGSIGTSGACGHKDWSALNHSRIVGEKPREIWVSSVASAEINRCITTACETSWGLSPQFVASSAMACGVSNAYLRPERLGVDRWLACIGGYHAGPGSVLIIDAGTALTVDFVEADGVHQGGLITPGIATMRSALRADTQLRPETTESNAAWLGRNTDDAVSLGTLNSALALVAEAERRFEPTRCILTGGEADLLATRLPEHWLVESQLVLLGLARLADENSNVPD